MRSVRPLPADSSRRFYVYCAASFAVFSSISPASYAVPSFFSRNFMRVRAEKSHINLHMSFFCCTFAAKIGGVNLQLAV